MRQFKLPDLGEGVHEGQIIKLLIEEGDRVAEDQPLMEVETDKAAVEIPSPYAGIIDKWHVAERQVVNVGQLMVTIADGAAANAGTSKGQSTAASRERTHASTSGATRASGRAKTQAAPARRTPASPAVRRMAKERGINLESIHGSGPGGRVLRADLEQAANTNPSTTGGRAAPMIDVAARHAQPSTPASKQTISKAAPPPRPITNVEIPGPGEGRDDRDQWGSVRCVPISQARKTIASVMTHSMSIIPHVTDSDDADITDLEHLRKGYNAAARDDEKLGLLAFVIRAVARALQLHPIFNASFDETTGEIIYKRYYNLAVGVQTERGLTAPVLRNVDQMSIPQINAELAAMIERVRSGSFTIDDTRGATYTISNAGAMGGSRYSTPIITHPQVAVLAIGRSRMQPWVVDKEVTPRLIMPLSHSMDHRIIDGALEIAFMKQVIGDLENPARLML